MLSPASVIVPVPVLVNEPPVPPPEPPSAMIPVTLVERLLPPTVSSLAPRLKGAAAVERAGAEFSDAKGTGRLVKIRVAQGAVGDGGAARRAGVVEVQEAALLVMVALPAVLVG